jgi:hypothetical protein
MKYRRRFEMRALTAKGTYCDAKTMRTRAQQPVSSRARSSWKESAERFKVHAFKNVRAHISISSRDIQPNQPCRPTRRNLEDPAPTIGIEHHTSGHLRLNGRGAVDADRRISAHVSGKAVRARRNQDLVDRAVANGRGELRHGAHRYFVQMPAVQHEGRHIGSGDPHDGS